MEALPKTPTPGGTHQKGGAGVVAEGEKALALLAGYVAGAHQGGRGGGAYGVASGQAHHQSGRPGAGHAEEAGHHRRGGAGEGVHGPGMAQQGGHDEEGEQRGDKHPGAGVQAAAGPLHGPAGPEHEGRQAQYGKQRGGASPEIHGHPSP